MTPQQERIVNYMKKNGTITQAEASNELGITKLATRVSELRRDGKTIYGALMKAKNRYGEPTSFMCYSLTKKALKKRGLI